MLNVLIKHVFGPGEHPDNSSEHVKNVRSIQTIYEDDQQVVYIDYQELVFDKTTLSMKPENRSRVVVLPRPYTLDTSGRLDYFFKEKVNLLGSDDIKPLKVRDKFLKIIVQNFPEWTDDELGNFQRKREQDAISHVEIGLTIDGLRYDEGEVIAWNSKFAI